MSVWLNLGRWGVKKEETLGGGPGNPAAEGRQKKLGVWMEVGKQPPEFGGKAWKARGRWEPRKPGCQAERGPWGHASLKDHGG